MAIKLKDFQRILIVHTAFVGDVILMTPLIRATKRVFPKAKIDALVIPQTAGLLQNNPFIRAIQIFDKRKNKLKAFWEMVRILKKQNFDAAFLPHSSFTTIALVTIAGIEERIGYDRNFSRHFLTQRVPFRKGIHRIQKNLELLKPYSSATFDIQTELFPDDAARGNSKRLLIRHFGKDRKLVAVAPGSVWNTKRWREEYYAQLTGLLSRNGYGVVLIGAKDERTLCERIKPENNFINLAGETNFLESAAVLENIDLLICNDSGIMHMANAVKTDVFAIFGPTVQSIGYFPYQPNDKVFEVDLECRPCSKHGGDKCPLGHHRCMIEVTPEWIFREIERRFAIR